MITHDKIKYKKEGNGVLADALCSSVEGALLTFRFRKDTMNMLRRANPIAVQTQELSPLYLRCLTLLHKLHIRAQWRTCWMDNLFPSLRVFYYAHKLCQTHCCGLVRWNRGFPLSQISIR